jgi:hypothetical protein
MPPVPAPPPSARTTRPRTSGRSSAACCSAGTSSSTRRPRSSSPPPSRPRSRPVRLPGRRAGARVFPPPVASRCSDNGSCLDRGDKTPGSLLHIGPHGVASASTSVSGPAGNFRPLLAGACPGTDPKRLVVLSSVSTTESRERARTAGHALRGLASRATRTGLGPRRSQRSGTALLPGAATSSGGSPSPVRDPDAAEDPWVTCGGGDTMSGLGGRRWSVYRALARQEAL